MESTEKKPVSALQRRIDKVHANQGVKKNMLLCNAFHRFDANREFLSIGTGCSGSDTPVMVMKRLHEFLAKAYGTSFKVVHAFSCENDKAVQEFLLHHNSPTYLFEDIRLLGQEHLTDLISGERVRVPPCDMYVMGSECDNFSSCNHFTNLVGSSCLSQGEGKSGETFLGGMRYVKRHKPLLVIIENVLNLDAGQNWADSDRVFVIKTFNAIGYVVRITKQNPLDSDCPHSRKRLYIIAHLVSCEEIDQLDEDFVKPDCLVEASFAGETCRSCSDMNSIEDFMLDQSHPEIQAWRDARMSLKTEREERIANGPKAKQGCGFVFELDHKEIFDQAGIATWPPSQEGFIAAGLWPAVEHLPRRCADIVYYFEMMFGRLPQEVVLMLNLSLPWLVGNWETDPTKPQHVPCLTCQSRPWFVNAKRDMTGVEALMYQGWACEDIDQSGKRFKDQLLIHIAGNAMNALTLVDVLYSALMFLDVRGTMNDVGDAAEDAVEDAAEDAVEVAYPRPQVCTTDSQSVGLNSDSDEDL